MDRDRILEWITAGLKAKKISADKAAREAGHPDVIRNLKRGKSIPKIGALRALAKIIGDPPTDLFEPPPEPNIPTLDELRAERDEHLRRAEELNRVISFLEERRAG